MISNTTNTLLVIRMVLVAILFLCITDAMAVTFGEIEKMEGQMEIVELKDHLEDEEESSWSVDSDEDDAAPSFMHYSPFVSKWYLSEQKCATRFLDYFVIVQPPPER